MDSMPEGNARALCESVLTSNLSKWKRQARKNFAKLSSYSLYAVRMENAPGLVAEALKIKPEDWLNVPKHEIKLGIEGDRLRLDLKDWPTFQRSLISLKSPQVIKDFSDAPVANNFFPEVDLTFAVQANTRLFYPIRDFPRNLKLGLIMPLREIADQGVGFVPFFEFEIGLLKPCEIQKFRVGVDTLFTDEVGRTYCIDAILQLSTWPEDYRFE